MSIKELLYDELFFVSTAECNDPFDGVAFLSFGPELEKWTRLVSHAWRDLDFPAKAELQSQTAKQLAGLSPLPISKARALDFGSVVQRGTPKVNSQAASALGAFIARSIELYEPRRPYFVSFSRGCDNALMWSHYSSKHEGHCLVFKAIDGQLSQCSRRRRTRVHRTTNSGIAPNMQSSVPATFRFECIKYEDDTAPGDAFASFPAAVSRQTRTEEERLAWHQDQRDRVLTKHTCWKYEQESRLILYPPMGALFGEPVALSKEERLLHFRPTQLVGLVLGARMPEGQKERLTEIVRERAERMAAELGNSDPYLEFVLFEAALRHERRNVDINPRRILSLTRELDSEDAAFASRFKDWQDGKGLFYEGAKVSRRQFL